MKFKTYLIFPAFYFSFICAQIKGTVTDQISGKPIKDVNIIALEIGTSTNEFGEFSLDVLPGAKLEFSHIGYQKITEIAVYGMNVNLVPVIIESDEIVVRAGLTNETLQQVSSSITVITEQNIRQSGAEHFQTLTDQVPNLNWAGGTSRPRYFQIRGVGERSHYFGEGAPNFSVGFVMDDMDLSGLGMIAQLNDISQIEVFKGPQSSLYGANAIGGLISVHSNDPSENFKIQSSLNFGSDNYYGGQGILNTKLFSGLSLRISLMNNYQNGYRENVSKNVDNSNKREEFLSRIKLKYSLSNMFNILYTYIYSDLKNGYDAWAPNNNTEFITYSDEYGEDSQLTRGYSIRGNFSFSETIAITCINSYTSTDLIHAYDGDWADSTYWHDNHGFDPTVEGWDYSFFDRNERNRTNFTQEIRLSLGPTVVGIFSKTLEEKDNAFGYLFGGAATNGASKFDFRANAGYFQFESNILSSLVMNANFRFEQNKYDYSGLYQGLNDNWEKVDLPHIMFNTDTSMLGYRLSLKYNSDKKTIFYSTISQGYKSGGINQQPYLSKASRPYEPEFIQNAEFGLKRYRESYRTQFSIFYAKRKNQQVSVSSQQVAGDPNSFLYFTANAGSGTIQGLEWEHMQMIFRSLILNFSLGSLYTWVDKFSYNSAENVITYVGDREAAMAPKLTGSFGLNYQNDSGLFASLSASYKHEYFYSDSHDQKSEPYQLLNFNIGKSFNKIIISFWARNVLDERYAIRGFYFGLIPPDYPEQLWKSYGEPRQIGLKLSYSF